MISFALCLTLIRCRHSAVFTAHNFTPVQREDWNAFGVCLGLSHARPTPNTPSIPVIRGITLCLKKTGTLTFSTVTLKPIVRFWLFLAWIFQTQLAIKWLFSFPPHTTFVFALFGENTTSKISLFYPTRYDSLINITRKNTFCSISDTLADISFSYPFFNCLQ